MSPDSGLSIPKRLKCAEIWAGSERTASLLELPGLLAWVHSTPAERAEAGGDIHYVSLCPSCNISRVALADVSGHGHAVAAVADEVRELMQRYLAVVEQDELMRDLNRAVQQLDGLHYATMVAVGWNNERGELVVTNAGHPPPCLFRALDSGWSLLQRQGLGVQARRPTGLPLGLLAGVDYEACVIEPRVGDFVVMYSDGVSESQNHAGEELGSDGLVSAARRLQPRSAADLGVALTRVLREFREGREPADDETIIVLQRV